MQFVCASAAGVAPRLSSAATSANRRALASYACVQPSHLYVVRHGARLDQMKPEWLDEAASLGAHRRATFSFAQTYLSIILHATVELCLPLHRPLFLALVPLTRTCVSSSPLLSFFFLFFGCWPSGIDPRDPPLSALGHQQARETAAFFAALPQPQRPTRILCSPYLRVLQTAAPTADALGLRLEVRLRRELVCKKDVWRRAVQRTGATTSSWQLGEQPFCQCIFVA
jgi:hypothetical protein